MKCEKCGTESESNFCPNCGNPLCVESDIDEDFEDAEEDVTEVEEADNADKVNVPTNSNIPIEKKKKKVWVWVIAIIVIVLLLEYGNSSKDNKEYKSYDWGDEDANNTSDEDNNTAESNNNSETSDEKTSDVKTDGDNKKTSDVKAEGENNKKNTVEKLSENEQKEFFTNELDKIISINVTAKELSEPKKYTEAVAISCIKDELEDLVSEGININDNTKYQACLNAYSVWFPNGKNLKKCKSLQDKFYTYIDTMEKKYSIEEQYDDLDQLGYHATTMDYNTFYIRYKINISTLDSIVGKIMKMKDYYYYANNAVYNSFFNDWTYGDDEYVIGVDNAFSEGGCRELYGYFNGETMPLQTQDGFEREVPIFVVCSAEEHQAISEAFEEYSLLGKKSEQLYDEILNGINNLDSKKNEKSTNSTKGNKQAGYIFPNSDSEYLTESDLTLLSKSKLRIARNEIYARHGYIFNSADLNRYFSKMSWYIPLYDAAHFDDSVFNPYEKANIDLITLVEERGNSGL